MTCVIGLLENDKVYVGADNIASTKKQLQRRGDLKVFIKDGMVFGCTSSYRMINLIQYQLIIPVYDQIKTIDSYMCSDFIEAVRDLFKNRGFSEINSNSEVGGNFIVGFCGKMYEVQDDFQIAIPADNFCCMGTGSDYALGAMKVLQESELSAEEKILKSLEVAEYYDPFVRRPFKIVSL